jgi:hypothetical protein
MKRLIRILVATADNVPVGDQVGEAIPDDNETCGGTER